MTPEEWLAAHPEAVEHEHAEGVFCDDCPDALRRNIKRILVLHKWTNDYHDRDCTCGWSMPFTETHQNAAHLADVLSATLTDLGWQRTTSLLASGALVPAEAVEQRLVEVREALGNANRFGDRCVTEMRRVDGLLHESLTTGDHHRVIRGGMPFCSCGLDLNGDAGRATDVWIEHRLAEVRAILAPAPAPDSEGGAQ